MSCESDPPEPDIQKSVDKGLYSIKINNTTTGNRTILEGEFVDTNWDPTTGSIFMNTDDSLSCGGECPCFKGPIGTIPMTISAPFVYRDTNVAIIRSILVSKSDIVCGTAAQLNAQLFKSVLGPSLKRS